MGGRIGEGWWLLGKLEAVFGATVWSDTNIGWEAAVVFDVIFPDGKSVCCKHNNAIDNLSVCSTHSDIKFSSVLEGLKLSLSSKSTLV